MAKAWKATHNQTEVGFEVIDVREANKANMAVVEVKYPTVEHHYTYCRKMNNTADGNKKVVIDGVEVVFTKYYNFISATRIYDTVGKKKKSTEAHIGSNNTTTEEVEKVQKVAEKIKAEMEQHNIPTPVVPKAVGEIRHSQYQTIKSCLECDIPVYLAGPAGSGKNYTVEQICKDNGWDFYFSNSVQQEYKLTGFIDAGGEFHETEFYKACTSEDECVFFLDEMDASIPEVLVLLNAAIANGYFEFPNGRVNLQHVHFVAAGNTVGTGADEMYTGRMVLDQATLDRFAIIEFGYDLQIEMSISNNNAELVQFIHGLREQADANGIRATFSYRCITMVSKLEGAGMDTKAIIKIAVMKGLDKDTVNTFNADNSKYGQALREVQRAA